MDIHFAQLSLTLTSLQNSNLSFPSLVKMGSSPWLMRCRGRHWASSFFTCGIPLDEEPDATCSSSPHVLSTVNMVFHTNQDRTSNKATKKTVSRGKQLQISSSTHDDSRWPPFEDDYIVFCIKEDGAIDVVKDGKSEASHQANCPITRPVNGKCGGDAERVDNRSNSEDGDKDGEEEESVYLDAESPRGVGDEAYRKEEDEARVGEASADSNQSQSDSSTESFAFPVLRWEGTGSPVQMPKSEHRRHKARFVRLQCCGF